MPRDGENGDRLHPVIGAKLSREVDPAHFAQRQIRHDHARCATRFELLERGFAGAAVVDLETAHGEELREHLTTIIVIVDEENPSHRPSMPGS